jgi:small subunit ribosomal protein S1
MRLKKGQTIEGEITRIVKEAVFVDVGMSREVVIPKVDIDQLNGDIQVTLEVGETIPVYIYHVPQTGGNPLGSVAHTLGIPYRASKTKRNLIERWDMIQDEYQIGDIVDGTVKNIKRYGAFVELPNGIDGLIHVSEMEPGFTGSPWDVVEPGEKVRVRIIRIEPHNKRIGLSLKDNDQFPRQYSKKE